MGSSEYYFIGMKPTDEMGQRLAGMQHEIWSANTGQLLRPLAPHVTMLPPPFANRVTRAELAQRVQPILPPPYSFEVGIGRPRLAEAYLGHTALVLPIYSDGAERLRDGLFRSVGDDLWPTTNLHLTLCQPLNGHDIPPTVVEEFTKVLEGMPEAFIYTGLTAFIENASGARQYRSEPFPAQRVA